MKKIIFHIDVNNAYLSWEATHRLKNGYNLDLRNIPCVIGGNTQHRKGVVLAKSIPAKKYGINTGESLYNAYKKYPDLLVVPPNFNLYSDYSNTMISLLREYSTKVERFSIDECFINYTNMEVLLGDPLKGAYLIKNRIKRELGFTVNIGISYNKILAKMASDFSKPDKVHTLFPSEISKKMWPLPVERLFMVGEKSANELHNLGIFSIEDLAKSNLDIIQSKLKSHGVMIWNYANGIGNSDIKEENESDIKGIGNSTTLPYDISSKEEAHIILLKLCDKVSSRLRKSNLLGDIISVTIKTSDFNTYSHQRKINNLTNITNVIYENCKTLFNESWKGEPIRLLGVRVSNLSESECSQLSIFDLEDNEKLKNLDKVIDEIRSKYNGDIITRSCFLKFKNKDIKNSGIF
ncbi:DNA polymerase IV [Gottschalkia purinilytica]|uniref:DNA polymerase IV n=1 Tax=Gottschalkia purinilytica TaxID=1503 RepID=A0A0L0WCU9_GOTPU|nr:DNA polymerase IV [Gottschalkia purinilytica]KNF09281.1 DNA polymerase IV [Gottschalkia purinilytica]